MSFIENTHENSSNKDHPVCTCSLCELIANDADPVIKTTKLCILILKSLKTLKPSNEFFSLKNDINGFITDHWSLLSKLKQFHNPNWRKSLLDAFNHCNLIESGKEVCHNRGYYKLRDIKKETKAEKKAKKTPKQPTEKKKIKKEKMEIEIKGNEIKMEDQISLNQFNIRNELFVQLQLLQNQMIENHNLLIQYPFAYVIDATNTNALPLESIVTNNWAHFQNLEQCKQCMTFFEMPKVETEVMMQQVNMNDK